VRIIAQIATFVNLCGETQPNITSIVPFTAASHYRHKNCGNVAKSHIAISIATKIAVCPNPSAINVAMYRNKCGDNRNKCGDTPLYTL
jgi:hypothetical protein